MVKLRLLRAGKKKFPIYKIVAADSRSPRDGRFIEALGQYNPNVHPIGLTLNDGRVLYWLKKGAQPTETVRSLFRRTGLWLRWTLLRRGTDESKIQSILEQWQMQQVERSAREADRKARRAEKRKKAKAAGQPEPAPPVAAPTP